MNKVSTLVRLIWSPFTGAVVAALDVASTADGQQPAEQILTVFTAGHRSLRGNGAHQDELMRADRPSSVGKKCVCQPPTRIRAVADLKNLE